MTPARKPIRNYSASQINSFNNCQRLWFFQSVLRIRFPQTPAQARGTDIHDILEHWLKTKGDLKKTHPLEFWRYMEWLIPHLPDPTTPHLAVEQEIWLDTPSGLPLLADDKPEGIPLKGFIDLGQWGLDIPIIGDLKTTTNMRYAKTPAELNQDVQLNTYARWVFGVAKDLDTVQVGHWYLKVEGPGKKPPKNIRSKKVLPVFTEITRAGNEECWQREVATMNQMQLVSLAERWEDVTPDINHCSAYGGCNFREKCGISAKDTLFQQPKKGQDMSFLDKIKNAEKNGASAKAAPAPVPKVAKKAAVVEAAPEPAEAAPEPAEAAPKSSFLANLKKKPVVAKKADSAPPEEPQEAAAAPEGILPPDSPSRTPSIEESEAIRDEAQAKLDAKEAKKAAAAEKKAKGTKTRKGKHKREMTLYIGCLPTKGEDQGFMMVEDWVAPVLAQLNATVLESTKKQDYRLLGYAEEKVALASAIQARVEEGDVPSALVCLHSGIGREVATLLTPLATDVVSAVK